MWVYICFKASCNRIDILHWDNVYIHVYGHSVSDNCSPNPCRNGGACNDGVDSYTCNCAAGFDGTNCENNIGQWSLVISGYQPTGLTIRYFISKLKKWKHTFMYWIWLFCYWIDVNPHGLVL